MPKVVSSWPPASSADERRAARRRRSSRVAGSNDLAVGLHEEVARVVRAVADVDHDLAAGAEGGVELARAREGAEDEVGVDAAVARRRAWSRRGRLLPLGDAHAPGVVGDEGGAGGDAPAPTVDLRDAAGAESCVELAGGVEADDRDVDVACRVTGGGGVLLERRRR